MILDRSLQVQTKNGTEPFYAMNVRCVKIDPVNSNVVAKHAKPIEVKQENVSEKLYPIPFSKELYINSKDNYDFLIYDMAGSLIRSGKFENQKINLSGIVSGTYLIKLINHTNNEIVTKKIIKQ